MSSTKRNPRGTAYRPAKFNCKKCPKRFRSQQGLDYHCLDAEYPCDLTCKICNYIATSKKDYKNHIKKGHLSVNTSPAMNDFVYETVALRIITETRPDGTVIKTTEVIDNRSLAGTGGRMLQAKQQTDTLMRATDVLATNTRDSKIKSEFAQLMYEVHDRIPHVQQEGTLNLAGTSDKKVYMFLRATSDSSPSWMEFPKQLAIERLIHHACDMYIFLLECGVQRLRSSTFRHNYIAQSLVGEEKALVVTLRNNEIVTQYSDVKELTECPLDRMQDAEKLMEAIQERKLEVIYKIRHILDDSDDLFLVSQDIEKFISRTKPKKTPGHISVLEIQN